MERRVTIESAVASIRHKPSSTVDTINKSYHLQITKLNTLEKREWTPSVHLLPKKTTDGDIYLRSIQLILPNHRIHCKHTIGPLLSIHAQLQTQIPRRWLHLPFLKPLISNLRLYCINWIVQHLRLVSLLYLYVNHLFHFLNVVIHDTTDIQINGNLL